MEAVPNMAVPSSPTMVGVVAPINRSRNSTVHSMAVVEALISSSMVVISIGMLDHLSNTTSHHSSNTTSHLISNTTVNHNTNQSTKMRLITTHHPHHLIIRVMINISREVIQGSRSDIQFSPPSNLVRRRPTSKQR